MTKILKAAWLLACPLMLSACFIEGGGCSGAICFGVSTEVCGNGLLCNDSEAAASRCPDTDDIETDSTQALNSIRGGASRCALTGTVFRNSVYWNDRLFAAADAHSRDMASNNFISELGSDGLGVVDRLDGQNFAYVSQSVAGGFFTVDEIISAWASDSRECSKLKSAQAAGFALACRYDNDSQFGTYWTLVMTGP